MSRSLSILSLIFILGISLVLGDQTPAKCGLCVSDCNGVDDGDYASCNDCEYYATCSNGNLIDNRPCADGFDRILVWNDDRKRCDYQSDCATPAITCTRTPPTTPANHVTPDMTPVACGACIRDCNGVADGDYASCVSCHHYATCTNGIVSDGRECAANTVWDDLNKYCNYASSCNSPAVECPNSNTAVDLTLTTLMAFNHAQSGNMFDLCALEDVVITRFDVNCFEYADVQTTIEIYMATNENVRFDSISNTAHAWTMVHQQEVTCKYIDTFTELDPFNIQTVNIKSGDCRGFYVTRTTHYLAYTKGDTNSEGQVYASNVHLQHLVGIALGYPFVGRISPRIWNGKIYYYTDPDNTPPPCGNCVNDCTGVIDGDYKSCSNSNSVYATCTNGYLIDNRPCPAGLLWNDFGKNCAWQDLC